MFNFLKKATPPNADSRPTVSHLYIIYIDGENNTTISNLCVKADFCDNNINAMASRLFFIPNVGETILDKDTNIEYEVKDVLRTIGDDEYGIQVRLKKRENKKYKF